MASQHVVIVGGSSGIGLATAGTFLAQGFKVTITGRDQKKVTAAAATLKGDITGVAMNAADPAAVQGLFAGIGTFDHLVLAFGSGKGVGAFASIPLADVRQGFEEKVFPHFACAQAALPHLAKGGSITFVSAITAHAAMPGTAAIGAANAAIAALVPTLAAELKPLRVNAVSPGIIDTPWWDFLNGDTKRAVFADYAGKTPVGRVGAPDDLAKTIAFVVGNGFMTGQTIICDGGLGLGA